MAGTATAPGVDRRPLISYLRVQADRERRILAALQSSSRRIESELNRLARRNGIGASVRRDQLAFTQAALHRESANLFRQIGLEVEAGRADAAAAAVDSLYPSRWLAQVMPTEDLDYLMRSAKETAVRGLATAEARMNLSRIPLSERVWKTQSLVSGKMDSIINDALLRGASARELAGDVMRYVRPSTPGGVRYAANRLARTELNNAFHATQVQEGIKTPWTTALRWNLSGSHPKPDECNEYAEDTHIPNGQAGVWRPEDVPPKPHPNCLCFTTPVMVGRDQFVNSFLSGDYDSFIDRIMQSGGIIVR
jgi:hypothetical protein